MSEFIDERLIKATRKAHCCEGCARTIDPGSPAKYFSCKVDGEFYAGYYHIECRVAEVAWNDERGTWGDEFDALHAVREDDEAEDWFAWLRQHHPIAADRLGLP